ncbi:MAG: cyclase [Chloroflexi bacterium]|nr:cyclase [Chloroflexota bacterium]
MVRVYIRHNVADFDAWKAQYDAFDEERSGMGVTDHAVYRNVDDPNDVTVWHDFDSRDSAESFVGADRLREVMETAGVVGAPTIWFVNPA